MTNLFAQIIGLTAIIVGIFIYQQNTRQRMLLLHIISPLLWVVHFGILGAWTGLALNSISALRSITFYRLGSKKRSMLIPAGFILLCIVATAITWQGTISLLPLLGMTTGTIALWQQYPRRIRLLSLISPIVWFIYDYMVGSYPGMINEAIIFCSILVGIYRFDIRKRT